MENHVDVVKNLKTKRNVQLVRLPVLMKYLEYDRRVEFKYESGMQYLEDLQKDIQTHGLQQPLVLAVSKSTQRAYLTEGNHRIVCLDNLNIHWVPLQVGYWFMNDDKNPKYPFIPATLTDFPKNITPAMCGFEAKDI